jgi:hypothetical protein
MGFVNNVLNNVRDILGQSVAAAQPIIVNKGPEKDIVAGDINIISITLSSEDGQKKHELSSSQCKTIDIYEGIHYPAVFCELFISDSIGLISDFPIIGEELITISFETPNNPGEPTTYVFHTREPKNKVIAENQKTMTYTISCCSPEMFVNKQNFVDKDFDDTISDIVKKIMKENIGTTKKLEVDKTVGIDRQYSFNQHPFAVIHSLLPYALSNRYLSHAFIFFENKHGYHFTTYEKLIERGRKQMERGDTDKQFFYDAARKESIEDVNIRNILAYNKITSGDALSKRSGAYVGSASTINMQTLGQRQSIYTANIGLDKFQTLDGDDGAATNTTGNIRAGGKTKRPTAFNFLPITSKRSKTPLTEAYAARQAFINNLSQNITQIHVYGDSEITVGDVIKCSFPSAAGFDNETGISRLDSGNYLVTYVRHMIVNGDRGTHTMSLELVKNDFRENS